MKKIPSLLGKGFCGLIVLIVLLLIVAGALYGFYSYKIYSPQFSNTEETSVEFVIREGDSASRIQDNLVNLGVLKDEQFFKYYLSFSGKSDTILPGVYNIADSSSIVDIVKIITGGEFETETVIVVPEGFSLVQIAERYGAFYKEHALSGDLDEIEKIKTEEFLIAARNIDVYRKEYDFLVDLPADASLEGYLFPDTYHIFTDSDPDFLIKKMLDNFDQKISSELRDEIKGQGKTLADVIIMASIVQKEAADQYMEDVAGVFYNRLAIGRKLESDTTVNYLTGKNDPTPSFSDTEIDSLYNTYVYPGLPPGPISNPGLAAIEASTFPSEHDYYFFITRLDTGEPIFSKTGEEHLQNRDKYL